jgi:transposase-like protein
MERRIQRGDPERRSYWEALVRRWKESGRAIREFCQAEGLRESAFYFWRRKLARRRQTAGAVNPPPVLEDSAPARSRSPMPAAPSRRRGPKFLPVHVVDSAKEEASRDVEIVLAGCRVRVPAGFDRRTLIDVLAALEAPRC